MNAPTNCQLILERKDNSTPPTNFLIFRSHFFECDWKSGTDPNSIILPSLYSA
uniref:Uncharacterized protein n=1 Tax=Arundo donax TaxID=35708 RepID=A0A0A9E3D9_ARUDO